MRWIDTSRVQRHLSSDWLARSQNLLANLISAANDDERKVIIKGNSDHWNEVRNALWLVGGEKCWYTEMLIPFKGSVIEHFRPKGKLAGEKHEGYWWLSFNWKNFRISSNIANVRVKEYLDGKLKGKGTYFPLIGGTRVYVYNAQPQDLLSIGDERPILLDPFIRSDVELLTFNHDGVPVPNTAKCKSELDTRRVKESIDLYCLDEGLLNAERAELLQVVLKTGSKIEELAQKQEKCPLSQAELNEYEEEMTELAKMLARHAKYSNAAIAAFKSLGNRGWTDGVLAA